jgi:hypothetical protein
VGEFCWVSEAAPQAVTGQEIQKTPISILEDKDRAQASCQHQKMPASLASSEGQCVSVKPSKLEVRVT